MSRRIPNDSSEQDAFTGRRKLVCYMQRAGMAKKAKRKANRRERREAKAAIRKEQ